MNMQNLTQKSIEIVQNAQSVAVEYQNMNIEQQHILYAMMKQDGGLIPQLLTKMGVDISGFENAVEASLDKDKKL